MKHKIQFKKLYLQVLIGISLGIAFGYFLPASADWLKPLSDAFIKLIKMLIAPIIFLSLASGIAAMGDMRSVGKTGGAALLYFLVMTSFALLLGLVVANIIQPGAGLNIDPSKLDVEGVKHYIGNQPVQHNLLDYVLNIIPMSFFSALVEGEILQVLLVAILFAIGIMMLGGEGEPLIIGMRYLLRVFFNIIHLVMHLSPIAAFAAMAYTIGKYGLGPLLSMMQLLACFYVTCFLFIFLILGGLLKLYCNLSIFKLLSYIKTELFIVLGTSSSETVLPNLMEKMEQLGCDRSVVGLVLPVGYSFNLDGTAIYLTMAAIFIAQATNTDLSVWQQLALLGVMIISSKGAAGVSGSGFIILASSLPVVGHVPVAGIVLILGIDRFMSEGRGITNMIGNTVSTLIISKWQGALDMNKASRVIGPLAQTEKQL